MFIIKCFGQSCDYYVAQFGCDIRPSAAKRFDHEELARSEAQKLYRLGTIGRWELLRAE